METKVKQRRGIFDKWNDGKHNPNLTKQNAFGEDKLLDLDELKSHNENYSFRNAFDPNETDPLENEEDDFLNSDYPEDEEDDQDDEDLEEEAENSVNQSGADFNETEEFIENLDDEDELDLEEE